MTETATSDRMLVAIATGKVPAVKDVLHEGVKPSFEHLKAAIALWSAPLVVLLLEFDAPLADPANEHMTAERAVRETPGANSDDYFKSRVERQQRECIMANLCAEARRRELIASLKR